MILVTKYFTPVERVALFETLGLQGGVDETPSAGRVLEEAAEDAKRKGRSARFAVRVVSEYRFTCALTGYRCISGHGSTIVDAAHIERWATSGNDDPSNGLALSKNAHWMFEKDCGLPTMSFAWLLRLPVSRKAGQSQSDSAVWQADICSSIRELSFGRAESFCVATGTTTDFGYDGNAVEAVTVESI